MIRRVNPADFQKVNSVCMSAFMNSVAPTLQKEGIDTFSYVASVDSLKSRIGPHSDMFVYEKNDDICGFIELKEGRHVAMLFVAPNDQKHGIGQSLITQALCSARTDTITVSASIPSISAYLRFGFQYAGEVSESKGLTYQPMDMKLEK